MSLRRRVLLGIAGIAILLLAVDAVLVVTVRASLMDQVDARLLAATPPVQSAAPSELRTPPIGSLDEQDAPVGFTQLTDLLIELRDRDGVVLNRIGGLGTDQAPPSIGEAELASQVPTTGQPSPFTIGSENGDDRRWRVTTVRFGDNILLVGIPLAATEDTIQQLTLIALVVTGVVLLALGFVGWWVLRLGVRPIDELADVAATVGSGDLTGRFAPQPSGTEAGRLSVAFNAMVDQLEQAFRARERSEEELRQFVSDASHELRTPLTSIAGYTELYRAGALTDPDELRDAMRRIEREAARMGVLVEDLLLLAQLDEGRGVAHERVDLAALVRDAVADARAVEPHRPISIDVPPATVSVRGDEFRLGQVVANLLGNARGHTPPSTPVRVSLATNGAVTELRVADDGPGLSPAALDHVFDRFFRADDGRSRRNGGTGLGLSIVDAIVRAHRGRVWVESIKSSGATFVVELPLYLDDGGDQEGAPNTGFAPSNASGRENSALRPPAS
jgi:two-component system OmpR family sensor kinase